MTVKVLSDADILSCMSVLTREGGESSFLLEGHVRVFERSRLFEVLNDVAFRVEVAGAAEPPPEQADGSRSQNREREPEPEAGELRGREAALAAEDDDGESWRRQIVQRVFAQRRTDAAQKRQARARSRSATRRGHR